MTKGIREDDDRGRGIDERKDEKKEGPSSKLRRGWNESPLGNFVGVRVGGARPNEPVGFLRGMFCLPEGLTEFFGVRTVCLRETVHYFLFSIAPPSQLSTGSLNV
jgi:hypothetical protein